MRIVGRLLADVRGNVAVIFAVGCVPMLSAMGGAVDFSKLYYEQRELQDALDAGVLAAAIEYGRSEQEREEIGTVVFTANARMPCSNTPTFEFGEGEVIGRSSCTIDTYFLNIIGLPKLNINVVAAARYPRDGTPCLLTLEPSAKEALFLNSSSEIDADCIIQVNSSNGEALRANSDGDIYSKKTCVNGGWTQNPGSDFEPAPQHCEPVADPFADLPVPPQATASCNYNDLTVEGIKTLDAGVYCKKLELNSGATVKFNPGIYVIRDGEFIVNSASTATGSGVMFYLTGSNNPRFNFNSNSHVNFSAPPSGPYAGVAFFQARNADADYSILNSHSDSTIEGLIYLPNSDLHLNSYGDIFADAPWTLIVVNALELNSDSTLRINTNYDSSSVPLPAGFERGTDEDEYVRLSR